MANNFTGLLDMIDGGGRGASGRRFEGGLLSDVLNRIGIKPAGYQDRMDAMQNTRPQLRPQTPQQAPQQPMQYGGRGSAGMPSRPMQGSGMTPANAYVGQPGMTQNQPISQPQMPPQPGMTTGQPLSMGMTPDQLRESMVRAFPGMDDAQLQQMLAQQLGLTGAR